MIISDANGEHEMTTVELVRWARQEARACAGDWYTGGFEDALDSLAAALDAATQAPTGKAEEPIEPDTPDEVVHDFGELLDRACDAAEFLRKVADILDRHGEAKDANDARYHADRLDSDPLDGP